MLYPQEFNSLISEWASADLTIKRAWIFGSYSRGEARPDSDLDVAVEIDPAAPRPWSMFNYWIRNGDQMQNMLRKLFSEKYPRLVVNLELYHRNWGKIPYAAICRSGLSPVYKRPRFVHLPDTRLAERRRQLGL
ncbi:nucleotidyltransferase domain-containing protein [Delftia sp. K82]|uniref:nucleotidyltransferase family protein n=1 Tax=Delftia sp. K82 TaxID=1472718 RepID=UPI000B4929F9